jgi:hypothetical protein
MKYVCTFLASYAIAFVYAWVLVANRMAHAARAFKEQGISDKLIDEHYRKMSGPAWVMSIRFMFVTGSIIAIIGSIICAFVS